MNKKYNIILCDPPWSFKVWDEPTGSGRSQSSHYPTMTLDDLKALPIKDIAEKDCALFLWATYPNLPQALEVGTAWGFKFKTVAFTWVKKTKHGKDHVGLGYWTRANPEILILFTRGTPKRINKSVRNLQYGPVGRHSEKPFLFHNRILELMGDLPRAELFARQRRYGWDCYGNEIDGLDIRDALKLETE